MDKVSSYIFEYEKYNVELKNVGSKQMFLVSKNDGENALLIDADSIIAIDYNVIITNMREGVSEMGKM